MAEDMQMPNSQPAYTNEPPLRRGSAFPWVLLIIIVILVGVLGVVFRDKLFDSDKVATTQTGKTSGYQAVFLTNGQVYFGKLTNVTSAYMQLEDIYYLQVVQPPLQGSQQEQAQQSQQQPQISLTKLGKELHGPEDKMQINRDQVIFYENITEEGDVVKAIREYQQNPNAGAQQTQQQTQQQNTVPQQTIPQQSTPSQ